MIVIDYDRNMRVNLRNSSGPEREVVAINEQTDGTYITFSPCGHTGTFNQIFHYEMGSKMSCWHCRFAAENVISEESLESK